MKAATLIRNCILVLTSIVVINCSSTAKLNNDNDDNNDIPNQDVVTDVDEDSGEEEAILADFFQVITTNGSVSPAYQYSLTCMFHAAGELEATYSDSDEEVTQTKSLDDGDIEHFLSLIDKTDIVNQGSVGEDCLGGSFTSVSLARDGIKNDFTAQEGCDEEVRSEVREFIETINDRCWDLLDVELP